MASRWAEVVRARPDAVALSCCRDRRTFAETDRTARAIAAMLTRPDELAEGSALRRAIGAAGPVTAPVAVLAEQGTSALTVALGVLLSGHPVVLLDPMLPADRWSDIVHRAGARLVLAEPDRRAGLGTADGTVAVADLDELLGAARHAETLGLGAELLDDVQLPPGDRFLVFTSGSSGTPKGVRYGDRILLNEAVGGRIALGLCPDDTVALVLPAAFAAGLAVWWMALLNGAGLVIGDPRLVGAPEVAHLLGARGISTLHVTPSLLRSLLSVLPESAGLPGVRLVTTCGEAVHGRDVEALRLHLDADADYISWSGSSETGHLAFHRIGPADPIPSGIVPVGTPAPNKTVRLLDAEGRPVPDGATGVVHLDSGYLAEGYCEEPESSPFGAWADGVRRYRMGDLARFDEHGVLHLLGRGDAAVKIRGYLVEPAEVEAVIAGLPEIGEAVVRAETGDAGRTRLVAWVSPAARTRTLSATALRRRLREKLPEWMVPQTVVLLPELPRNERGKVDRKGLTVPAHRADGTSPRGSWETVIADIWCEILDVEAVHREDDFMELGGDSLHVEEMLTRVGERLSCTLVASDLAGAPTLADFAARVGQLGERVPSGSTVTLRGTGTRPPLFCFAGAGASAITFLPLATELGADQPVHCFQPHGLETRGMPDWTVRRAARRHLAALLRIQPEGPYHLVGHSLGGLIALETAHLLAARGQQVASLVLLDTYLPETIARRYRELGSLPAPDPGTTAESTKRALWRARRLVLMAGIVRLPPEDHHLAMTEQGLRVARVHRPRPWRGPVLVVRSTQNTDEPSWWGGILAGDTEFRTIRTDHVSLVRAPHVATLAEWITTAMDGAGVPAR
ncbi:alpha/beta fold hydrolase [Nakamurella alba]|uniref:alpha/beta fold hydrolase n=1 Tax=Nakamurella alba TaxID=2665158 RepID=UPI0018AC1B09|nr:alpha/beta fold hydrolase [Nakamurella alba]